MPKGNEVYIPQAGRGVSRQRKRARRRQRELLEELSFLFEVNDVIFVQYDCGQEKIWHDHIEIFLE